MADASKGDWCALQAGFTLTLELPPKDRFFDDKADILDINGFQESQEFVLRADEEPPEDLLAYLRIVNLSGARLVSDPQQVEGSSRLCFHCSS